MYLNLTNSSSERRRSQVVRQGPAKPLFPGSIPGVASNFFPVSTDAGVAELVDAMDLKSIGILFRAGSSPALGTIDKIKAYVDFKGFNVSLFSVLKITFCANFVPTAGLYRSLQY